jgi:hypothetical protein
VRFGGMAIGGAGLGGCPARTGLTSVARQADIEDAGAGDGAGVAAGPSGVLWPEPLRPHEAIDGHAFKATDGMPAQIRASTAVRSVNGDGSHPGPARLSCQSEVKATKFTRNWGPSGESQFAMIRKVSCGPQG